MKPADAIDLIQKGVPTDRSQQWADLGCGSGTFTHALLSLLPQHSKITAVDQQSQKLGIPIDFVKANFEKDELPLSGLDGILMANSLHYIKDKRALIQKLETYFFDVPYFLIVEYDTERSNPWVPYPLSFVKLQEHFGELGYSKILRLADRPSVYNSAKIYAAVVRR